MCPLGLGAGVVQLPLQTGDLLLHRANAALMLLRLLLDEVDDIFPMKSLKLRAESFHFIALSV